MSNTLKERLILSGLTEEQADAVIAVAGEKLLETFIADEIEEALENAKADMRQEVVDDLEYERECELEARAHEADCERMYGDYAEELAGVDYFGRGTLYTNDAGEPLGWD